MTKVIMMMRIMILKEERFRMLDYRSIYVLVICAMYALAKYLHIKLPFSELLGVLQSQEIDIQVYRIYGQRKFNSEVTYVDLIQFYNQYFVPCYGNLTKYFARNVFKVYVGRDACDAWQPV